MRSHDWPEQLFEVVKRAQNSKFEWGKNDCALFACDCAKAMTGVDYAAGFRGKYNSRRSAMVALRKIEGVESISELASKYLGKEIALTSVQRGDVVLKKGDSSEALGVVVGSYAVFLTSSGIQTVLLSKCILAWRVE